MINKEDRNKRHKRAMQRKKAHVDSRIAEATIDKGLLLVLTGNGKGKSSSAFGMIARALGCLLYTSPSPRDGLLSRMPSSA